MARELGVALGFNLDGEGRVALLRAREFGVVALRGLLDGQVDLQLAEPTLTLR